MVKVGVRFGVRLDEPLTQLIAQEAIRDGGEGRNRASFAPFPCQNYPILQFVQAVSATVRHPPFNAPLLTFLLSAT